MRNTHGESLACYAGAGDRMRNTGSVQRELGAAGEAVRGAKMVLMAAGGGRKHGICVPSYHLPSQYPAQTVMEPKNVYTMPGKAV